MKNKDKKIFNLVDKICELEGFIEFLENRENKIIPSYNRKIDRTNLKEAKLELERLRLELYRA